MSTDDRTLMERELTQMAEDENEQWLQQCMYKIPAHIKNLHKSAYTPQVVSFGPYHFGNEDLKPMEAHKDRARNHFLKRAGITDEQGSISFVEQCSNVIDLYEHDSQWDGVLVTPDGNQIGFFDLVIRDACFMLEIFSSYNDQILGYAETDPIFSKHGKLYVMPLIRRDMLMLENQLPMVVLHCLLKLQNPSATEVDTLRLALSFFFHPDELSSTTLDMCQRSIHILDMYRTKIVQDQPLAPESCQNQTKPLSSRTTSAYIIRSAVELQEAGIKIRSSKSTSLRDITFKNGELQLPKITIDLSTVPVFLNLIAYERSHVGIGNEVTAYAIFLDDIVDDAEDIRLLHYKGIILNGIDNDKAAAELFNLLSKDVPFDKRSSPHAEVYSSINDYCTKRMPKYRALLYSRYWTSPWAVISILAATFLIVLTMTQTVYTILPYYNRQG